MSPIMELFVNSPAVIIAVVTALIGIGIWIGKVIFNLSALNTSLSDFMKEIRTDIKKIFERLPSPTLSENSPLGLNALGQSISGKLRGRTWAEQVAKQLADTVQGKSPYEIQSQCFDFVEEAELGQSMRKAVLDCAYENGISEDQVLDVLAIELRDIVLSLTGHHPDDIPDRR